MENESRCCCTPEWPCHAHGLAGSDADVSGAPDVLLREPYPTEETWRGETPYLPPIIGPAPKAPRSRKSSRRLTVAERLERFDEVERAAAADESLQPGDVKIFAVELRAARMHTPPSSEVPVGREWLMNETGLGERAVRGGIQRLAKRGYHRVITRAEVTRRNLVRWIQANYPDGSCPTIVRLANQIPTETPEVGVPGRPRVYGSNAERQRAYRERQRALRKGGPTPRPTPRPH